MMPAVPNLSVLKFGGSCLPSLSAYADLAEYLSRQYCRDGQRAVVVVSAMKGETNRLAELVRQVNRAGPQPALDHALVTGEILSVALLQAALHAKGIPTGALMGNALGIVTNGCFGQAKVLMTDPAALEEALSAFPLIIVPGAQAVTAEGAFTTLGRNSSDLTAVIISGMLGLQRCAIYSDVPAVYTADPNIVDAAQPLPKISFALARRMTRFGAKVLHHRSVEWAERHRIEIECKAVSDDGQVSTIVGHDGHDAAIVVAPDAILVRFQHRAALEAASIALMECDLFPLNVKQDRRAFVLPCDSAFAVDFLLRSGIPIAETRSAPLVARVSSTSCHCWMARDKDGAVLLATRLHESLSNIAAIRPRESPPPAGLSTIGGLVQTSMVPTAESAFGTAMEQHQ